MPSEDHDWITLHRLRFPTPVSAMEHIFPAPELPLVWRFCPRHTIGPDSMTTLTSDFWGGLAIHESRETAQRMFDEPGAHLPFLGDAVEAWHALGIPYAHRGKVSWHGEVRDGISIRPAREAPEGTLAVITSAGYDDPGPDDLDRITRFIRGVQHVIDFYGTLDHNIRRDVFNGGFDGREGFTLSLWDSDAAMMKSAYASGTHKAYLDEHRKTPLFDRSSFTRVRIIADSGTWDGEPLAGAA